MFQRERKRNISRLRVGAEAAEPRPLLRRRRSRRLRRARLRHRRVVLSRARVDGRPHADEAARQVARDRRADAALRRQPERVVGHERRVRPAAVPARAQSEQRARQPALAGRARFPADADDHLLGPPRAPAHPGRIGRRRQATAARHARNPTTSRSCRRSRSGCSAIATTGIRRTRSPTTPPRGFASPCRSTITWSRPAFSTPDRQPPRRAAPIEGSSRVIPRASYSFTTPQPVRYLGVLVSRMTRVDAATVALDIVPSSRRTRPTCAARRRCSSRSLACRRCRRHAAGRRAQHGAADGGREPAPGIAGPRRASAPPPRSSGCIRA